MELSKRVDGLLREANKLARSAADLVAMAEELQREIGAPAGREVAAQWAATGFAERANAASERLTKDRPLPPTNGDTVVIRRPARFAEPERTDPVRLDAVIDVTITDAWTMDIFQVIEKLKQAGIPAIVKKSQVNGTNYIDVTHGDLIQALAPGATAMQYRWYGAGQ